MNSGHLVTVLRRFGIGRRDAESTDRDLLERYAVGREEAAFAALVRRHGGMVWGVCRRVLADANDADDAFQATFLVLLHKAASLRGRQSLAGFLQGVAWRLARRVKVEAARRRVREQRAEAERSADVGEEITRRDLRQALDEELDRLPDKYRAPLVLCYLEGKTYTEAARQLGWKDGTVCGRLARARELLRQRLLRRGLTLSAPALLSILLEPMAAPAASVAAVLRTAALFALGQSAASTPVAALAQGILHTMTITKLKTGVALLAALCVFVSAGLAAHRILTTEERTLEPTPTPVAGPGKLREEKPNRTDRSGDPLPPDAIARLGTIRFRHGYNVFDIAFSPDGARLVSSDWYGAHLWETATGREIRRIGPHFDTSLRSLSLSPDGKTVALAEHHQGMIQIWDTASGKLLTQFRNGPDNDDRFCSVAFSPDGKILASHAGKIIRLWEPATGKPLRQWDGDSERIHRLSFSPDGKTLISGGDDRTIHFWDVSSGKESRRIVDHPGPIAALALSPDGKMLASLGSTKHEFKGADHSSVLWLSDNKLHLWDATAGKKLRQLEVVGPEKKGLGGIGEFVFAPDGKTLAMVGQDRTIRIWDARAGKELRRWKETWVTSLAFSPEGKVLATGGIDATVRFWDPATGRELREQAGHWGGVQYLTLSPDGRHVATASMDRTVRIWDAATGRQLHRLRGPEGEMAPIAFSADGRTLITAGVEMTTGSADRNVRVWNVAAGAELRQLPGLTECSGYAVSADGRIYAFVVDHEQIVLWDAAADRKLAARIEHPKGIASLTISADNRSLMAWCGDSKVHVWDIATGKERRPFAIGADFDKHGVAFSPDGRWAAWAGREREICLYDLAVGKVVRRIAGASHFVSSLAFAPDGRTLASTSLNDPTIYLWETATGQRRHHLTGHQGRIFTLVFSADGKRLISGSEDTTALVWDLVGGHDGRPAPLSDAEAKARWNDLASDDAETAYGSMRIMTASPEATIALLRTRLQPIPAPDAKQVARWIADLDRDAFAARENATKELEKLGETVESVLRESLAGSPMLEKRRRVEALLEKLDTECKTPSAASLQSLRAIEVLERIGTPAARQILQSLAGGTAEARQTRETKASLERLARRPGDAP